MQTFARMSLEEKVSLTFWAALLVGCFFCYFADLPATSESPAVLADAAENVAKENVVPREQRSVAQLGQAENAELLTLIDHYDSGVRGRALAALIRRQAADELLGLLEHPRASVRSAAPLALASLGELSTEQLQRLATGTHSPDQAVRESTAYALAMLGAELQLRQASAELHPAK